MRRTKILAASFVASTAVAVPALASPAQAQVVPELTPSSCGTLGSPLCGLIEDLEELLEPLAPVTEPVVDPLVTEVVDPVLKAVEPVLEPVLEPLLTPAPSNPLPLPPLVPAPAPAPAPGPGAGGEGPGGGEGTPGGGGGGGTKAVSAGAPAPYRAPLSTTRIDDLEQRRGVPSVPSGRSLELTPLGIPSLSVGSDLTTPSLDDDLALPAAADSPFQPVIEAVTAGSSTGAEDSTATAAILAIVMLAVASGLLVDQARRPVPTRR